MQKQMTVNMLRHILKDMDGETKITLAVNCEDCTVDKKRQYAEIHPLHGHAKEPGILYLSSLMEKKQ